MKLLLTGGTGFFGKSLLRHWRTQQQMGRTVPEVWVLSRNPERFLDTQPELANLGWLRLVTGDVCDFKSLPHDQKFTDVLHAATDSTLGPTLTPLAQFDQIVAGTRNLLDFAVRAGARRFLFTSSGAVYGRQPAELSHLPEDWLGMPDPLLPASSYGVAKRTAEHLCALYYQAHGLETVIARCFAFVGPDLPQGVHFAIGNFIRDALTRDAIRVAGDGTPLRSYLYQEDLAQWLECLLLHGASGQAYNVGSDQAVSIAELAHLVRDTLAPLKPVVVLGQADPGQSRNRYVPQVDKIRRDLSLSIRVPLQEAISRSASAYPP